jgi:hypothetical protein
MNQPHTTPAPWWYISGGSDTYGPFTWTELVQRARSGELKATDILLQEGNPQWIAADSVPGLFPAMSQAGPPVGPPNVAKPAAIHYGDDIPVLTAYSPPPDRPFNREKAPGTAPPPKQGLSTFAKRLTIAGLVPTVATIALALLVGLGKSFLQHPMPRSRAWGQLTQREKSKPGVPSSAIRELQKHLNEGGGNSKQSNQDLANRAARAWKEALAAEDAFVGATERGAPAAELLPLGHDLVRKYDSVAALYQQLASAAPPGDARDLMLQGVQDIQQEANKLRMSLEALARDQQR